MCKYIPVDKDKGLTCHSHHHLVTVGSKTIRSTPTHIPFVNGQRHVSGRRTYQFPFRRTGLQIRHIVCTLRRAEQQRRPNDCSSHVDKVGEFVKVNVESEVAGLGGINTTRHRV